MFYTIRVRYGTDRVGYVHRNRWAEGHDYEGMYLNAVAGHDSAFKSEDFGYVVGLLPLTDKKQLPLTEIIIRKIGRFNADGTVEEVK